MRRAPVRCANGFLTGVVAGVGATLVLFMCRLATGVAMPQEALAERMVLLLPSPAFALLLAELQELAKPLAFAAATGTMLIGFGLGGVVYRQVRSGRRSQPGLGLVTAVATWAFLAYIFLPFIEGGILDEPLTTLVPAPFLPVAAGSLAYGALLAADPFPGVGWALPGGTPVLAASRRAPRLRRESPASFSSRILRSSGSAASA
jgi:hypothetical protein